MRSRASALSHDMGSARAGEARAVTAMSEALATIFKMVRIGVRVPQ
jgi:hypothetical protein